MPRAYDPRTLADEQLEGFETSPERTADSNDLFVHKGLADSDDVRPYQPDSPDSIADIDAAIALLTPNGYAVTPPKRLSPEEWFREK